MGNNQFTSITVILGGMLLVGCGSGGGSSSAPSVSPSGEGGGSTSVSSSKTPEEICRDFDNGLISETRTQTFQPPSDLRDFRYCEVIPWFDADGAYCAEVYNSLSFNDCPEDDFRNLDQLQITNDLGAHYVSLNGTRHWVINEAARETGSEEDQLEEKILTFGNIQMRRPAILASDVDPSLDDSVQPPYTEIEVYRNVTWRFLENNEIYELTSPDGSTYVMQSYSRRLLIDQSMSDLPNLGSVLDLPVGWEFDVRVLSGNLELRSDGTAILVQDEFENTYQKVSD